MRRILALCVVLGSLCTVKMASAACDANFTSKVNVTSQINFPATNVGGTSYTLVGTISVPQVNSGPVKAGALSVFPGIYELETDNCSGHLFVNNGDSCTFTIQFAPVTPGLFNGQVDVRLTESDNDKCDFTTFTSGIGYEVTDPELVYFTAPIFTVTENGVNAVLNVNRVGDVTNVLDVDYDTSDGTAINAVDYTAQSGTLHWDAFESGVKQIFVPIIDNVDLDGTRNFFVSLSGEAPIDQPNPAVVDILDDEDTSPGRLEFYPEEYSFAEGNLNPKIYVVRRGGFHNALQTGLIAVDQTAIAGADYNFGNPAVQFDEGEVDPQPISFSIIDDNFLEGGEFFSILFDDPKICQSGFANCQTFAGIGDPATVNLIDNESPGTIQFAFNEYSFDESIGNAVVTVQRTGGNKGQVCADYTTSDGTAVSGEDYNATNGQVCFADGSTAPQTIQIGVTDDVSVEGGEAFSVLLSNPSNGASLGTDASTVHLVDNDSPGFIGFSSADYTFNESIGTAQIAVLRKGGSKGEVTVHYSSLNGTAIAPDDFTSVAGTLTWEDGDASPKFIQVPIIWDIIPDPTGGGSESFSLILDSLVGNDSLSIDAATVNLIETPKVDTLSGGGVTGGCALQGSAQSPSRLFLAFIPALLCAAYIRQRICRS